MKNIGLLVFMFSLTLSQLFAQIINCDHIYFTILFEGKIYDFDPSTKTYKDYSLSCPVGSFGLAIAPDFKKKDKLTFYTIVNQYMYYFDGTKWVNTNHYVALALSNIAGGGGYIYMLDATNSKVYRYDGKGDATLLIDLDNHTFHGIYDLVCDKIGNFYLMDTWVNKLIQYDSEGKILKEFKMGGIEGREGGGFAFNNNIVYAHVRTGFMIGEFRNGKIMFSQIPEMYFFLDDCASCPLDVFEPIDKDTTPVLLVDVFDPIDIDTTPVVEDVVFTDGNIPLTIKDRKVILENTITVTNTEFEIAIWDKSVVDGDSISLYLNGQWLLENYEVVKTRLILKVKINPKNPNNYLILYALNLGKIPPNTAAVAVLVDGHEHKLTLISDMNTSGALNFIYKPK